MPFLTARLFYRRNSALSLAFAKSIGLFEFAGCGGCDQLLQALDELCFLRGDLSNTPTGQDAPCQHAYRATNAETEKYIYVGHECVFHPMQDDNLQLSK
ncbi:MAG TPA: hypothetical protein VME86_02545 [Acidobacteriaceae bacterium]|nr:hypothetical protein [Acidobacteriaceae bacterium]